MGSFVSVERKKYLENLADRYQYWEAMYPGLQMSRYINRLHSDGIEASEGDIRDAIELINTGTVKEVVKPADVIEVAEAAEILGITEIQFKEWWIPSINKQAMKRSDYVAPEVGTPVPERTNATEKMKPALFTRKSVEAIKKYWTTEG